MSADCGCSNEWRKPKPNGTCGTCGGWLPGERPPASCGEPITQTEREKIAAEIEHRAASVKRNHREMDETLDNGRALGYLADRVRVGAFASCGESEPLPEGQWFLNKGPMLLDKGISPKQACEFIQQLEWHDPTAYDLPTPASPDLVAAARGLSENHFECDDPGWHRARASRWDELAAALQNTPQPDAPIEINLRNDTSNGRIAVYVDHKFLGYAENEPQPVSGDVVAAEPWPWPHDAITADLNALPFVKWDRFINAGGWCALYGWIARDDGRADFVILIYTSDVRANYTSSAERSAEIDRLLGKTSDHNDCERIEDAFPGVVNVYLAAAKQPGGRERE